MRAIEISESHPNKLVTLVTTHAGTWYETDVETVAKHFRHINGSDKNVDKTPGIRYFVFAPKSHKTLSLASQFMMLKDHELSGAHHMGFSHYLVTKQDAEDLQALVDVTQAQYGTRVYGDFILYKGKVYPKDEFLQTLPVVAQISTGAVHEVPSDALWTLSRLHLKYQTSAQRVVVFKYTQNNFGEPWCVASIKDGKLSDIQSQRKLDKITQVQLGKEVAQALGLTQKVTVNTHIIPESKLHDTLRAINDHPGVNRAQLYWTVLKLKKLPPYLSKEDVAAELVKLGLVKEDERELMHVSAMGKLVLARVNAGHPVSKTSLIR